VPGGSIEAELSVVTDLLPAGKYHFIGSVPPILWKSFRLSALQGKERVMHPGHFNHHVPHHHLVHHHPPHGHEISGDTAARVVGLAAGVGLGIGGPVGAAVVLAGAGSILGAVRLIRRVREKSDTVGPFM